MGHVSGMKLLTENIRSVLFSGYPCPLTSCQFLHAWEDDVTSAGWNKVQYI